MREITCFLLTRLNQVWCTSLWPVRAPCRVPSRERTYPRWTTGTTTLVLLWPLTSNTSPHQMASLWTGWAGVWKLTSLTLPHYIPPALFGVFGLITSKTTKKDHLHPVGIFHLNRVSSTGRNLYWADSKLKRLEVALLDGRYRKHLVKTEVGHPSAVAVNPRLG